MLSSILNGSSDGDGLRPTSPGLEPKSQKRSSGGRLLGLLRQASGSSSAMQEALANTSKVEGFLSVVVHRATGISPAAPLSPICRLVLGSHQTVRSRPVPRTDSPVWEERMHLFVLATDREKELQVQIIEDSRGPLSHSTYAQATVSLPDLVIPMEYHPVSMWLDLNKAGRSEERGRIHLSMTFRSILSHSYRAKLQQLTSDEGVSSRSFGVSLSAEDLVSIAQPPVERGGGPEEAGSRQRALSDSGRGGDNEDVAGRYSLDDPLRTSGQLRKRDNFGFPVEIGSVPYSSLSTKQFLQQNSKDFTLWGEREAVGSFLRKHPIPHAHRAEVWVSCSQIDRLRWDRPMRYEELLKDHVGLFSGATEQIEKDLPRTFPGHAIYRHELGIEALRRVLIAFSWSNSFVGYCQSMNFIAGFLLLVLDEEDSFWMLKHLVDEKLPQYFSPNLVGCRADQYALVEMMAVLMPEAHMRLQECMLSIHFITVEWFMRLYIGILPTECTLWVLDCLVCEGNEILFGVALAFLRSIEMKLQQVSEFDEMFFLLNSIGTTFSSPAHLMRCAYEELDNLEPGLLARCRQQFHVSLELSSTDDDVKKLIESSDMSQEEIQKLYSQFNIALRDSKGGRPVLDKETFAALIGELYTNPGVDIVEKLFKIFDRKGTGYVDFHEFLCGICAMSKGTPEEKLHMAFQVFDINDDGFLDVSELILLFGVQQIMYSFGDCSLDSNFEVDDASIERLVEKYDVHGNGKLDFEEFCACLSQPPYTLLADRLQLMATTRPREMPMCQALEHIRALSPALSREGSSASLHGSDGELLLGFSVEEFKHYDPLADSRTPGGP